MCGASLPPTLNKRVNLSGRPCHLRRGSFCVPLIRGTQGVIIDFTAFSLTSKLPQAIIRVVKKGRVRRGEEVVSGAQGS
jgi:hypothetical protein